MILPRIRFFSLLLLLFVLFSNLSISEELYTAKEFIPRNTFTTHIEGPVVDITGTLFALNYQRPGTIAVITPGGEVSIFAELPEGSHGNGTQIDSGGRIIVTDKVAHHIFAVDPETRMVSVLAEHDSLYEPNDITITSTDVLYASDPDWKRVNGRIWHVTPGGDMTIVASGMGTVNGIEISPDENKLYVNESMEARIWAFDVAVDGSLSNKRLFHSFDDHALDAMRCDVDGNLYVARYNHSTIAMLSPEGELIREIMFSGKKPSNMAFGGPDGCTVYVTVSDNGNIETFRAARPGRMWRLLQE